MHKCANPECRNQFFIGIAVLMKEKTFWFCSIACIAKAECPECGALGKHDCPQHADLP